MAQRNKKQETDFVALESPFMRVPRMKTIVARDLLDLGFRHLYELEGRSAESIFADLRRARPDTPADRLPYLRLAVYYAENGTESDPSLLHPAAWNQ